jgi:circadian clock protein KaiB
MKPRRPHRLEITRAFERRLENGGEPYVLSLYLAGMTPRSTEAFANIKSICEKYLAGRYELEVIDIYQNPAVAKEDEIIASPTLVKRMPAPIRRLIGDLAREDRILVGLDLKKN